MQLHNKKKLKIKNVLVQVTPIEIIRIIDKGVRIKL